MLKLDARLVRVGLIVLGIAGVLLGLSYFVREAMLFTQNEPWPVYQHVYSFITGAASIVAAVAVFIAAHGLKHKQYTSDDER